MFCDSYMKTCLFFLLKYCELFFPNLLSWHRPCHVQRINFPLSFLPVLFSCSFLFLRSYLCISRSAFPISWVLATSVVSLKIFVHVSRASSRSLQRVLLLLFTTLVIPDVALNREAVLGYSLPVFELTHTSATCVLCSFILKTLPCVSFLLPSYCLLLPLWFLC